MVDYKKEFLVTNPEELDELVCMMNVFEQKYELIGNKGGLHSIIVEGAERGQRHSSASVLCKIYPKSPDEKIELRAKVVGFYNPDKSDPKDFGIIADATEKSVELVIGEYFYKVLLGKWGE